jgi:hypothetical protein
MINALGPRSASAKGKLDLIPAVFDSIIFCRPSTNFRDGTVVANGSSSFLDYFAAVPFHDSLFFAIAKLVSVSLPSFNTDTFELSKQYPAYSPADHSLEPTPATTVTQCSPAARIFRHFLLEKSLMARTCILPMFSAVFLFVKCYASCLVAELSQLCYGGVLRAIALSTTDGLTSFACGFIANLQPVVVPVGRISLGRIMNVCGSSIDPFVELAISSLFQSSSCSLLRCASADGHFELFNQASARSFGFGFP